MSIRFTAPLQMIFIEEGFDPAGTIILPDEAVAEVRQAALIRGQTDAQLQSRVLELAANYDIPLTAEALSIRREERHIYVEGSYVRTVPIAPRLDYPWKFDWEVDAYIVDPVKLQDLTQ